MAIDAQLARLRVIRSQEWAFEEFCCQLARRDPPPSDASFFRFEGAGGDGGVECVWQLADGTEWGWQAKWLDRLDGRQLTASVSTALELHPRLTRYVVCLPFDLTGPTGRRGRDRLKRWQELCADWTELADAAGASVAWEFWGASELLDRLATSDPSGGRTRYWFDVQHLGTDWFEHHLSDTAVDAEPRYQPELRVDVPIAESFEALGRTPRWRSAESRALRGLVDDAERFARHASDRDDSDVGAAMKAAAATLEAAVEAVRRGWIEGVGDVALLQATLDDAHRDMVTAQGLLRDELESQHGEGVADSASFRQRHAEYMVSLPAEQYDLSVDLGAKLEELQAKLRSPSARARADRRMLVIGTAGQGKTHAICDIGLDRLGRGLLSIVVLGQHLTAGDIWEQIRQRLGLPGDMGRDELLDALDAAGEASGHPLLVFVDALNERTPRTAWRDELAGVAAQVARRDHLALCLSCRTTFLDEVMPDTLEIPTVEHRGFAGVEYEAAFAFFTHYGLQVPTMPMLQPEFANPLFLGMVCRGLAELRPDEQAAASLSLHEVVELLVDSAERRAARALDVHAEQGLVRTAINGLLEKMHELGQLRLEWRDAHALVDALLPNRPASASLFDFLIRDGLLTEARGEYEDGSRTEVRFGFERLGEYLFVASRLDAAAGVDALADSLPLGEEQDHESLQGLCEALAILAPERFNAEITELDLPVPRSALRVAFVRSMIWRSPDSFGAEAEELVREALSTESIFDRAMEELLSLTARPGHPFGAGFFDRLMRLHPMPRRDAVMCWFLHSSYDEGGMAMRLSTWALHPDLGDVPESICVPWTQTLAWFCLAADRRVRDHASKAMVALMRRHPSAWPSLLDELGSVDDDYIVERVLLACYGSLLLAGDGDAMAETAGWCWRNVFEREPPSNAMIRDAARCIVEAADHFSVLPDDVDLDHCRPPYTSVLPFDWPLDEPEEDFFRGVAPPPAADELPEDPDDDGPARWRLRRSIFGDDFSRYTLNFALDWSDRPAVHLPDVRRWIYDEVMRLGFDGDFANHYDANMIRTYGDGRARRAWAERIGKKYQWIALYRVMGPIADHVPSTGSSEPPPDRTTAPPPLQAASTRNLDPTTLVRVHEEDVEHRGRRVWWSPVEPDFGHAERLDDTAWLDRCGFPDSHLLIEVTRPSDGRPLLALESMPGWNDRPEDDPQRYPYRDTWMQIRSYLVLRGDAERFWRWLRRQDFDGRWMPEGYDGLEHSFVGEYPWGIPARRHLDLIDAEGSYGRPLPVPPAPTANRVSLSFENDAYQGGSIGWPVPAREFFADELRWDGTAGFTDPHGLPVFSSPGVIEPGPSALLVDREWMTSFLDDHELDLFWTALSELHVISGGIGHHDLGYSIHSRSHRLLDGEVISTRAKTERHRRQAEQPD